MIVKPPSTWPTPLPGTLAWELLSFWPLIVWAGKKSVKKVQEVCQTVHDKGYEQARELARR